MNYLFTDPVDPGFTVIQVETVDDYDEYCHYVAGLVGLGLSKLFLAAGSEVLTPDWEAISNSMGLFLQVQQCSLRCTMFLLPQIFCNFGQFLSLNDL